MKTDFDEIYSRTGYQVWLAGFNRYKVQRGPQVASMERTAQFIRAELRSQLRDEL